MYIERVWEESCCRHFMYRSRTHIVQSQGRKDTILNGECNANAGVYTRVALSVCPFPLVAIYVHVSCTCAIYLSVPARKVCECPLPRDFWKLRNENVVPSRVCMCAGESRHEASSTLFSCTKSAQFDQCPCVCQTE